MASRALEVDYKPAKSSWSAPSSILESATQTPGRWSTMNLDALSVQVVVFETGEELRVEIKPDARGYAAAFEPIKPAIEAIKQALNFEPGWDSYGARAIDRRSVRPALELVIRGSKRCGVPRIVPTNEGGFDLHWLASAQDDLQITVQPDGGISATWFRVIEGQDSDEEGRGFAEAGEMIDRFCSARH